MVNVDLAANILAYAKQLAPAMAPKPTPETAQAWAKALNKNYPEPLWVDAVLQWSRTADRMLCPRDMLHAAEEAKRAWESDPVRGPQLRAHRQQLQDERDKQLAQGTFAQLRGYQPQPQLETPKVTNETLQRARQAAQRHH